MYCVGTSRIDTLWNMSPLYTIASNTEVSVSENLVVNLSVGCRESCLPLEEIPSLLVSHIYTTSVINMNQTMGEMQLFLIILFSILAKTKLAKESTIS